MVIWPIGPTWTIFFSNSIFSILLVEKQNNGTTRGLKEKIWHLCIFANHFDVKYADKNHIGRLIRLNICLISHSQSSILKSLMTLKNMNNHVRLNSTASYCFMHLQACAPSSMGAVCMTFHKRSQLYGCLNAVNKFFHNQTYLKRSYKIHSEW